jgi:hypothetical protein
LSRPSEHPTSACGSAVGLSPGRRPRGEPARFGDHHSPGHGERHDGGLAGPGWGDQDRRAGLVERGRDVVEDRVDREVGQAGGEHGVSLGMVARVVSKVDVAEAAERSPGIIPPSPCSATSGFPAARSRRVAQAGRPARGPVVQGPGVFDFISVLDRAARERGVVCASGRPRAGPRVSNWARRRT